MEHRLVTHVDEADVARRLAELGPGLTIQAITQAVLVGELHRDNCTPDDPPTLPGTLAWGKGTSALRAALVNKEHGWHRSNTSNFCLTINPDKTVAIVFATGERGTALDGLNVKNPHGKCAKRAVDRNRQLALFDVGREEPDDDADADTAILWFLLVARIGDQAQIELKLPGVFGAGGRVEEWDERIVIPTVTVGTPEPNPVEADGEEIDIEIVRRDG